ncbi:MAG: radical SAM family heme chaperone HemW [Bacteroidia bacterium]|nr:radical SAM family heme chaperone HemW [Bacteroidia bacterium]MDW8089035.1 radical SAM family heme chaperone HemW [Bacteroidia bacterium]
MLSNRSAASPLDLLSSTLSPLKDSLGLYLHIPFCRKACHYCDFYFVARPTLAEAYIEALTQEIALLAPLLTQVPIKTVFLGGGTPSLLPLNLLNRLWRSLEALPTFAPTEVSLEANPEDVNKPKLNGWKALGITRLSLGIQTFSEKFLAVLGRHHSLKESLEALTLIAQDSFYSWNLDLIFGMPEQRLEDFLEDLTQALHYNPPHLSLYGLTIEERTVLHKKLQRGRLRPIEDEVYAEMYLQAYAHLKSQGYEWYEISNWALPGHECAHNWRYWVGQPYVGLGPSAHSYIRPYRWFNSYNLRKYLEKLQRNELPMESFDRLGEREIVIETWLTGFRTRAGLPLEWIERHFPKAYPFIKSWQEKGWVIAQGGALVLSPEGALWSDYILRSLL